MTSIDPSQIVLVDMDGVIAGFDEATAMYLATYHPHIPLSNDRETFHYRDFYDDPAHVQTITDHQTSENFFRDLPPIEDALYGWQRIIDLGYHPRICSSPLRANPRCVDEKRQWIRTHLGAAAERDAIIDKKKEEYPGIALIDDRPGIVTAGATWQQIVFDQPYNQHILTDLRLYGWRDPTLPALLDRCQHAFLTGHDTPQRP